MQILYNGLANLKIIKFHSKSCPLGRATHNTYLQRFNICQRRNSEHRIGLAVQRILD